MKSIAVIGANGMLGTDLCALAESRGIQVIRFCYPDFDITKESDIVRAVASSDVIVNCAAYTAVDKAEAEPELCRQINAVASGRLAQEVRKYNKYLVHISTDFVFGDLTDCPQSETSPVNPLSVYGRTKYEGEQLIWESACSASVMRVQWTYGRHGNNFVSKMLELAAKMSEIKVVEDQVGAPTPVTEAAAAILCLASEKAQGLYHFAAASYTNRCENARFIFECAGIKNVKVIPCKTGDFKTPAQRPLNSKFDCSKIDAILDFKRSDWKDALRNYICGLAK